MSKMKRISASVMAFVLVLCVGYFSAMSPTSAWFYDSGVIDSGDSFIFGDLSVNTKFSAKRNIVFDAAKKFNDPDEILFDDVINVDEIQVINQGTIPARIYAGIKNAGEVKGLRWFMYTDKMLVDGSVKKTIESVLPELTDEALDIYNVGEDGNSGNYIICNPGEMLTVKVATWIDYDSVSKDLAEGLSLGGDIELALYATQDVDGAVQR